MTSSAAVMKAPPSVPSAFPATTGSATAAYSDTHPAEDVSTSSIDDKPLVVPPEETDPIKRLAIRDFQRRVALLAQKAKQGQKPCIADVATSDNATASTSTSNSKSTDLVKPAVKKAAVIISDPSGARIPFPSTSASSSPPSKATSSSHPTASTSTGASTSKTKTVTFTKAQPTLVSISSEIPVTPSGLAGHPSSLPTDNGPSGKTRAIPAVASNNNNTDKDAALAEHLTAEIKDSVAKKLSSAFPATSNANANTTSPTPSNALTVNNFISRVSKTPTLFASKRPSNLTEEDYVYIQQLTSGGDSRTTSTSSSLEANHSIASQPGTATERDRPSTSQPDTVVGPWVCIPNTYYLKYENSLPDARHPLFNSLMQDRIHTLEFMLEKQEACLCDTRAYLKFLRGIQKLHAEMESPTSLSSAP